MAEPDKNGPVIRDGDNGAMDTTHDPRELLERLREADPSEAPAQADELARRLAAQLDPVEEEGTPSEPDH